MTGKVSAEVKKAYWYISQGNLNVTAACKKTKIARSTLYRYPPFIAWRKNNK